jgi:hypothetical protein
LADFVLMHLLHVRHALLLSSLSLVFSSCAIIDSIVGPKKKDTNTVFVDATQMDTTCYADHHGGIKFEIFFLKKSYFQSSASERSKALNQVPQLKQSLYKDVVGYHLYTLSVKDTFTDQIFISKFRGVACFVVWCDGQIMHSQILPWRGTKSTAIHIKFVGQDMYVKYSS